MIPKPLRTLATGTAVVLGGIFALNLVSSATIGALRLANEAKRVKKLLTFPIVVLPLLLILLDFVAEEGCFALYQL